MRIETRVPLQTPLDTWVKEYRGLQRTTTTSATHPLNTRPYPDRHPHVHGLTHIHRHTYTRTHTCTTFSVRDENLRVGVGIRLSSSTSVLVVGVTGLREKEDSGRGLRHSKEGSWTRVVTSPKSRELRKSERVSSKSTTRTKGISSTLTPHQKSNL